MIEGIENLYQEAVLNVHGYRGCPPKARPPIPHRQRISADLQPRADYRLHRDTFSEPHCPREASICAIMFFR